MADVDDLVRIKSHQTCAGRIAGNGIIGKHDLAEWAGSAIERAIAFHRDNSIRDNKMNWNGGADIQDALLNALPVENILRPSVS